MPTIRTISRPRHVEAVKLLICALAVLILLGGARAGKPARADAPLRLTAPAAVERMASRNLAPSLAAREAAEFLITPAMLVQQGITEGSVVTYPGE